ncbi:MAG: hypothetical protein ACTSX4_13525, partial [Candidatus Helarchaeota archaeon]
VITDVKSYSIQINASHDNIDSFYENASITFTFDTTSHDTSFVYEPVAVTPHLDNVTIKVIYWDIIADQGIDNSSGHVSVTCRVQGATIQYWVQDLSNGDYYVLINSSNLNFTTYKAEINISYRFGSLYTNRTIPMNPGISFEVRQVNTYYSSSFNESNPNIIQNTYSDWPWGVNLSIFVSYIDLDHSDQFVCPSSINVSGNYEFQNGANYSIVDHLNGTFEIVVKTVAATDLSRTFQLNFTLYTINNSTLDTYGHQNFSIYFTLRKPQTRLDVDSNVIEVPWNDNATILATYYNTEESPETTISDATINLNVTVSGSSTYKSHTLNNWISWKPHDTNPGVYVITLNTSWVDVDGLEIKIEIEAEYVQTQKATNFVVVTVRFIYINLEYVNGTTEIRSDVDTYFMADFRLTDIDHSVNITNNSIPAYENVTFFSYYNTNYNKTGWEYGNFTILELGNGLWRFNFTFKNGTVINDYDLRIKVNGSLLKGFQTADGLAEAQPFYTITIRLRTHQSGITINRTEILNGQLLFPQVPNIPTYTFIDGNETIYYGEDINVTFFWFDYNHSLIGSEPNKTGIETYNFNTSWNSAHLRLYNMYTSTGLNESYKGLFVLEIRTSTYNQYQPFTPIIGIHEINVSMSLIGSEYETEYTESFFTINLTILPVKTNLTIVKYALYSGTEISDPIVPWGESPYFMGVYLNYTTKNGTTIQMPENVNVTFLNNSQNLMWGNSNNTIKRFTHEVRSLQYVKIFTLTDDSINAPWVNNFKNFTITIIFNRTNYEIVNVTFNLSIAKHQTHVDFLSYTENVKYLTEKTITFFYKDDNYTNTFMEANITNFNVYCNWTGFYYESIIPGTYRLRLPGNHDYGDYVINLTLTDNHTYDARILATILLNLTVQRANISIFGDTIYQGFAGSQVLFQGFPFTYATSLKDEYGNPLDAVIVWKIYDQSTLIASGVISQVATGRFQGDIFSANLMPDKSYKLFIEITPTNQNYAPITQEYTIFIYPIYANPLFIILMISIGLVSGFVGYHQVKWWLTPYPVKKIMQTKKQIKKHKDFDTSPTVKNRSETFKETFNEYWTTLNLDVPNMVSSEILKAGKILSDIKRTRITTSEVIKILETLKSLPNKEEADKYLEKQLIPPLAREKILEAAGLIKIKIPEIIKFTDKLNEIKGRTYTYEEGEKLYRKLKSLEPNAADQYLWNEYLIYEDDRDELLNLVNIQLDEKALKKRRKFRKVKSLTDIEIKRELKRIPKLSLEEKKRELAKIKKIDPREQRKYIAELKKKYAKKEEKAKTALPKKKSMTEEEIIEYLNKIPGLSDDDMLLYLESLSYLSLNEQKKTLEKLKDSIKSLTEGKGVKETDNKDSKTEGSKDE